MRLSGRVIWQWITYHWPMDLYASLFFLVLAVLGIGWWVAKRRPVWREHCVQWIASAIHGLGVGIYYTVLFPWLVVRGLFFSPNGVVGSYKFDPFKTMFVLASSVMILRLGVGGRSFEDVRIGPDVLDKFSSGVVHVAGKLAEKKNKRKGVKTTHHTPKLQKRFRPWFYIKGSKSEPVTFYELLVFLVFAGLFYFRHDLSEGDRGNLFDKLVEVWGMGLARKYGAEESKPFTAATVMETTTPPDTDNLSLLTLPADTTDAGTSGGGEKKGRKGSEGGEKTGGPPPLADDPFLK